MTARLLSALALSLVAALPAAAQEDPDAAVPEFVVKPVTELDFEGYRVDGQVIGPDGKIVLERRAMEVRPMIQIRKGFDEKMSASVDEVK